jgi:hypothetical protein
VGTRQEPHLVVGDAQAAFRVTSNAQALKALRAKSYREDASPNDLMGIRTSMRVGYLQIYILDPDRNIIEINAADPG